MWPYIANEDGFSLFPISHTLTSLTSIFSKVKGIWEEFSLKILPRNYQFSVLLGFTVDGLYTSVLDINELKEISVKFTKGITNSKKETIHPFSTFKLKREVEIKCDLNAFVNIKENINRQLQTLGSSRSVSQLYLSTYQLGLLFFLIF